MFESSVGIGVSNDSYKAGVEAAVNARHGLGQEEVNLAIVFASATFTQVDMLRGIQSVIGEDVPLAGASTAGELTNVGPTKTDSVVVMLFSSDTVHFAVSSAHNATGQSYEAGKAAYDQLVAQMPADEMKLVNMFADGLTANPMQIIAAIGEAHGTRVPIVGGSAGDGGAFKQTYQYCNGTVISGGVVLVGFGGALNFSVGVRHGWLPIGAPKTVTDAEGSVVKKIDGRPAIELYSKYLGEEEAAKLGEVTLGEIALSYPLGVRDPETEEMLLRAPFFVDDEGSVTCGGEIKVGDSVQLMIGSRAEAVEAARESAHHAMEQLGAQPAAAIIYSCHVRNTLFGSYKEATAEVDAVVSEVGQTVPLAGFYTYAEQAPIRGEVRNMAMCKPTSHNETLVTVLLGEAV